MNCLQKATVWYTLPNGVTFTHDIMVIDWPKWLGRS